MPGKDSANTFWKRGAAILGKGVAALGKEVAALGKRKEGPQEFHKAKITTPEAKNARAEAATAEQEAAEAEQDKESKITAVEQKKLAHTQASFAEKAETLEAEAGAARSKAAAASQEAKEVAETAERKKIAFDEAQSRAGVAKSKADAAGSKAGAAREDVAECFAKPMKAKMYNDAIEVIREAAKACKPHTTLLDYLEAQLGIKSSTTLDSQEHDAGPKTLFFTVQIMCEELVQKKDSDDVKSEKLKERMKQYYGDKQLLDKKEVPKKYSLGGVTVTRGTRPETNDEYAARLKGYIVEVNEIINEVMDREEVKQFFNDATKDEEKISLSIAQMELELQEQKRGIEALGAEKDRLEEQLETGTQDIEKKQSNVEQLRGEISGLDKLIKTKDEEYSRIDIQHKKNKESLRGLVGSIKEQDIRRRSRELAREKSDLEKDVKDLIGADEQFTEQSKSFEEVYSKEVEALEEKQTKLKKQQGLLDASIDSLPLPKSNKTIQMHAIKNKCN